MHFLKTTRRRKECPRGGVGRLTKKPPNFEKKVGEKGRSALVAERENAFVLGKTFKVGEEPRSGGKKGSFIKEFASLRGTS